MYQQFSYNEYIMQNVLIREAGKKCGNLQETVEKCTKSVLYSLIMFTRTISWEADF